MSYSTDFRDSYWWSCLGEFGEEVLVANRKKYRIPQQKIATILGIHQSEVSRIERGITKPRSIPFAEAICRAYSLSPTQKRKYLELLSGIPATDSSMLESLFDHQTIFIAQVNRAGNPNLAIHQAENLLEWTKTNIQTEQYQNSILLGKIARLYLEASAAWWDVTTGDDLNNHTSGHLNSMHALQLLSRIDITSGIYYKINQAFHAYVSSNFLLSTQLFEELFNNIDMIDDLWHMEVLRAAIISASKCKNYQAVRRIEEKISRHTSQKQVGSLSKGYLLEGLARAYGEFSTEKSLEIFALAKNHILAARSQPNFLTIRYVQLVRSYIPILIKTTGSDDLVYDLVRPALDQAARSGFKRHAYQIQLALGNNSFIGF